MLDALTHLNSPLVIWSLFAAAAIFVLVDYIFPTDWPCQLGYVCFAAAMFFVVPASPLISCLVALAVWIGLVLLHFKLFHHFLSEPAEVTPARQPTTQNVDSTATSHTN